MIRFASRLEDRLPVLLGVLCLIHLTSLSAAAAQQTMWPSSLPAGQVIDGDYFAAGPRIEISGTVNGDLYAFGGNVTVDGRVNGDVLAAGGRVTLRGAVSQNVRVAGGHVTIAGAIGRNLTVAAGNVDLTPSAQVGGAVVAAAGSIELAAPVEGSVRIAAGNLILSSRIGGDVDAAVGALHIASRAGVAGNINYWSDREARISEGAKVDGEIIRGVPREREDLRRAAWSLFIGAWLALLLVNFVSTLILGLLSVRFLPRFHEAALTTLGQRPWVSLGIGFVTVVVVPVICALLFATVVTVPLALILLAAFFILLYWARIFAIARIGEAILGRFRKRSGRASAFVVGLLLYYILVAIPGVGWLVAALVALFGLGAELMARRDLYLSARSRELI